MKNRLPNLAIRAEKLNIYSVESEARGILYLYNDGEYAICTPRNVLRLTERQAEMVARELPEIMAGIKDLRRLGTRE